MAFRADENERSNFERGLRYVTLSLPEQLRKNATMQFKEIADELGPVVDGYPSWHPLVRRQQHPESPTLSPGVACGYQGVDHTICFRNGFLTCPYSDGADVVRSVRELADLPLVVISAKKLRHPMYHENATSVLVTCRWRAAMLRDGTIPLRMAAGLLLERELPFWRQSHHADTWDTLRHYFLGTPCGSRSSLFVNERTGQGLKRLWNSLIQTGLYGPINVGA